MRGYRVWLSLLVVLLLSIGSEASAAKAKAGLVIRASSTITANENGTAQIGLPHSGGYLILDITELGVAQTLTITLETRDPISGSWVSITSAGTSHSTEGIQRMCVSLPVCVTAAFQAADRWAVAFPFEWRLKYVLNNGTNATFSVFLLPYTE